MLSQLDDFKMIAKCSIQSGRSVRFWLDTWDLGVPKWSYPQLFSFARNKEISVQKFCLQQHIQNFHLTMSPQAVAQLYQLNALVQAANFNHLLNDSWFYIWGALEYSSKQAYLSFLGQTVVDPLLTLIWRSSCQSKHNIFMWLLFSDRINTRNLLEDKELPYPKLHLCIMPSANGRD